MFQLTPSETDFGDPDDAQTGGEAQVALARRHARRQLGDLFRRRVLLEDEGRADLEVELTLCVLVDHDLVRRGRERPATIKPTITARALTSRRYQPPALLELRRVDDPAAERHDEGYDADAPRAASRSRPGARR